MDNKNIILSYQHISKSSYNEIFKKYATKSLLDKKRYLFLLYLLDKSQNIKGNVCECGVYKGGTALGMIELLQNSNKKLFLFDTFFGVPENSKTEKTEDFNVQHNFKGYSYETVRELFKKNQNVEIIKGNIEHTLNIIRNKISFSHIDLNYFNSTLYTLKYIYEVTQKNGIILIDDYGFDEYKDTIKRAVDEFSELKKIKIYPVETGQCIIFK